MYQKIGILVVLASVLLSAAVLVTPVLRLQMPRGMRLRGTKLWPRDCPSMCGLKS